MIRGICLTGYNRYRPLLRSSKFYLDYPFYKQIAATRLTTRDGISFLQADRRYAAHNPGWNIVPTSRSPLRGSQPRQGHKMMRLETVHGIFKVKF